MVLEKLDVHMQKNKIRCYLTKYTKIRSKCIKDLNIRSEIKKLLEENMEKSLMTLDLAIVSWEWHQKQRIQKRNKWDHNELLNFCASKDTINKVNRQPTVPLPVSSSQYKEPGSYHSIVTMNKKLK